MGEVGEVGDVLLEESTAFREVSRVLLAVIMEFTITILYTIINRVDLGIDLSPIRRRHTFPRPDPRGFSNDKLRRPKQKNGSASHEANGEAHTTFLGKLYEYDTRA